MICRKIIPSDGLKVISAENITLFSISMIERKNRRDRREMLIGGKFKTGEKCLLEGSSTMFKAGETIFFANK